MDDRPWIPHPALLVSADGSSWTTVVGTARLGDATLSLMRDPKHGRGEIALEPLTTRFVRLPRDIPARPLAFAVE
jgi:hypothetical protein